MLLWMMYAFFGESDVKYRSTRVFCFADRFERSDTFRFEVPRMLFDDTAQLESYVLKSKDRYADFAYITWFLCAFNLT